MYNMEVRNVWVLTSGYTFILILWYIGTVLLILGICAILVTKKGLPVACPWSVVLSRYYCVFHQ